MKYYIETYKIIFNLSDWRKIRKCLDLIDGNTVFCIEIFCNRDDASEVFYWETEEHRDLVFNEINDILS